MRTPVLALVVALAAACPSPKPPTPPPPTQFRLQVYVHDDHDALLTNAHAYRDNVTPRESITLGADAGVAWTLPPSGFNVCALLDHYSTECAPVPLTSDLTITLKLHKLPDPVPPVPPTPTDLTKAQLEDFQGDLMLFAPEIGCQSAETRIDCSPAGLAAGWVWTVHTAVYSLSHRQFLYAKARAKGWTHFAINVTKCVAGESYHNLYQHDAAQCAAEDATTILQLDEIRAAGLIPVCAGAAPDSALIDNLPTAKCLIALNDWDNTCQAWSRIKWLNQVFPSTTLLYFEAPGGCNVPQPTGDDEPLVPTSNNGGAWLRAVQARVPNFVGVLYELDATDRSFSAINNTNLLAAHAWFRDVQEVNFESDTYWKFWQNYDESNQQAWNDQVVAHYAFLHGCLSGCSTHQPPTPPVDASHFIGELDLHQANAQHIAGDFANWSITTHITQITIGPDDRTYVTMDNNRPNVWPDSHRPDFGPILWSMGVALKAADGKWYYSAPIQVWRGLDGSGGNISNNNVVDPGGGPWRGQLAVNWFGDMNRWGALAGVQPQPGDTLALFVCAGDCRDANGDDNHSPVHERSNAVLFKMPAYPGGTISQ